MNREHGPDEVHAHGTPASLTDEQLAAFEHGWAATIMPVKDGWKIRYFSTSAFEEEPGTIFETIDAALEAVREVLPEVNSPEERERARRDLERRRST